MEGRYYIVKKGDSLWGIAHHFGCSIDQLAVRNGLIGKHKNLIKIGQKLYLPESESEPDLRLNLCVIGLNSKPIKHAKFKLTHDGKEAEAQADQDGRLHGLHIQEHLKGLKIEFENYEGKWQKIFDESVLPLGEKTLQINILTDLLKGQTLRKDGATVIPDQRVGAEVKRQTPQPAAPLVPHTPLPDVPATPVMIDTRTSNGQPTTINAPLFASNNLYLNKPNEKFRQAIIDSAKRYDLTPHALAAIIHAEAAKTKDGGWIETCAAGGSSARGLGQFLPAAWFQYIAKSGTLGNTEALKLIGAAKLEAAYGKLYKIEGKDKIKIDGSKIDTILSWRDNGGYSIDAIGSYSEDNLNVLKNNHIDATALPPDEKVKIAYIMHHEGPGDGVLYLQGELGKTDESSASNVRDKLARQFKTNKDDGTSKAKALADQFGGDYVKAYFYFLANHTNTMVRTKNFMLKHDGFGERSAFEVIQSVSGISIEKPKREVAPVASVSKKAVSPQTGANQEVRPLQGVGGISGWSDPLDICTIRVGGYGDSESNPASARRKSLFGGRDGRHTGIDLNAMPGTPIKAVANGEIVYSGSGSNYGNVILLKVNVNDLPPTQKHYTDSVGGIEHDTIYFMYAHLNEITIKKAGKHPQAVRSGQIIGKTGDTGNATGMIQVGARNGAHYGAHLHFEGRRSPSLKKGEGKWFDPKPLLNRCD